MKPERFRGGVALAVAIAVSVPAVRAQVIDVERAHTFVVASRSASFREDRADAARTGLSRVALPTGTLRTVWSASVGTRIDQSPVVDEQGVAYVVDAAGGVTALASDGAVRWRLATGAASSGAAALLADGTLLFVDSSGRAFGLREGSIRWTVALGTGGRFSSALALDDGGCAVSSGPVLALLDAEGGLRARATVRAPIVAPLVSSRGRVFAVDSAGTVWSWQPGPAVPERVGTFGEPTDAMAAFHSQLVTVPRSGRRVSALNVATGQATPLAEAGPGERFAGPPTVGPRAPEQAAAAFVVASTPSGDTMVLVDPEGREQQRTLLVGRTPMLMSDGGSPPAPAEAHTPPLVDASGTLVFATSAGDVGVVHLGTVERASEVCSPRRMPAERGGADQDRAVPVVVGLAPIRPGVLVATCRSGTVLALEEGSMGGKGDSPNL